MEYVGLIIVSGDKIYVSKNNCIFQLGRDIHLTKIENELGEVTCLVT